MKTGQFPCFFDVFIFPLFFFKEPPPVCRLIKIWLFLIQRQRRITSQAQCGMGVHHFWFLWNLITEKNLWVPRPNATPIHVACGKHVRYNSYSLPGISGFLVSLCLILFFIQTIRTTLDSSTRRPPDLPPSQMSDKQHQKEGFSINSKFTAFLKKINLFF